MTEEQQQLHTQSNEIEQRESRQAVNSCIEVLDKLKQPYGSVQAVVRALVAYYGVRIEMK